jgi:hypothetical protein
METSSTENQWNLGTRFRRKPMNNQQSYWTIRQQGGWAVKMQGSRQMASVHQEQKQAWQEARRLAGGAKGEARLPGSVARTRTGSAAAAVSHASKR